MTVLVGVLCSDGLVIGADSVATFSAGGNAATIEQADVKKIHIIHGNIIIATTGAVGLSQRFVELMEGLSKSDKLKQSKVMAQATFISQEAINNFKTTMSPLQHQPSHGWGLGALIGMPVSTDFELFEFDTVQFHPERKGHPDQDTKSDQVPFIASMGSGQRLADPFLGFVKRVLWANKRPTTKLAILGVLWTLQHVIELNTGGVGGAPQIAVLTKDGKGKLAAQSIDVTAEVAQQVTELEAYILNYPEYLQEKIKAAQALPVDLPARA